MRNATMSAEAETPAAPTSKQETEDEGIPEEEQDDYEEGEDEGDDEGEGGTKRVDEALFQDRRRLWGAISEKPCRVVEVLVTGNKRTKEEVITRELKEALLCDTFGEIQVKLAEAYTSLQSLGIFEEIHLFVDSGPKDVAGTATVHVDVAERGVLSANLGTYVQGKEQTVEMKGALKNTLGFAESLDAHISSGAASTSANSFSLGLIFPRALYSLAAQNPKPRLSDADPRPFTTPLGSFLQSASVEARVSQSTRSWREYSSHSERGIGGIVTLANGPHQLHYNLTWRENSSSPDDASCSPAIRQELGHSLLSSLRYEMSRDRRDSRARPSKGWILKSSSELAGIGTDPNLVRFFKQELEFAMYKRLHRPSRTTLIAGFHAGALFPWTLPLKDKTGTVHNGRPPLINDRFFLGGPSSLRGFRAHGVGPSDWRSKNSSEPAQGIETAVDFLGGDLTASASVALAFDLPVKRLKDLGFHAHVFSGVGSLVPASALGAMSSSRDSTSAVGDVAVTSAVSSWLKKAGQELRAGMRVSCGGGIVWPTMLGKFEANYCVTFKHHNNDIIPKHGFQFGINTSPY